MCDRLTAIEPTQADRWEKDVELRERELGIKKSELELKQQAQRTAGWKNPLIVAIVGASVVAAGNIAITWYNDQLSRNLEQEKAEAARILAGLNTATPAKAATNLKFLIATKLISKQVTVQNIESYFESIDEGTGPVTGIESDNRRLNDRALFRQLLDEIDPTIGK